ncbi:MarR family winged helix-turn-helix transcriptional regulator [Oerskovia douganii]|uniref:MarR family winged helix-turn-helix transcriptional regulator n=1 Tax=Oerskovia douganii TaxID=2762210 RepID=UPI002AB1CAF2|nr:MarR family winged helix-turn-helix transcriptional regulator [Oerskovia douganii]
MTLATPDATRSPLGWPLAALLRGWSARVDALAEDLPDGTRCYQVLSAVVHDTPPSQAALAARLGIDRTVMTYLIDKYVECDLVERQADPTDRRARRIVATAKGREVLADLDARVAAAEEDLLGGLDAADRATLRRLLDRAADGAAHDEDRCAVVVQGMDATSSARARPRPAR